MSRRNTDFRVEPFINTFGQILNPGDEVIAVGGRPMYGDTWVEKGTFTGVYYGNASTWVRDVGWVKDPPKEKEITGVQVIKTHSCYRNITYETKHVLKRCRIYKFVK
jgi:hypothetical protein